MIKVLVINGVWGVLMSGMLTVAVLLYNQEARYQSNDYHLASLQDSMKGASALSLPD